MRKKILGVGNALTDVLYLMKDDVVLSRFGIEKGSMQLIDNEFSKKIQATLLGIEPTLETGGSASNTVSAIAKLGLDAAFVGKVGKDKIGDFFVSDSLENGVTPHIIRSDTPSGSCTVLVSPDSERTMCTFLGAASELQAVDICRETIRKYDFLHVEGYLVQDKLLIETIMKIAKEEGLEVSIDLASFNIVEEHKEFMKTLLEKYVDIAFANKEEAIALTGKSNEQAAELIGQLCEVAIVKNGAEGSFIYANQRIYPIEAYPATSVDTTGAGDSYAAGFLYGYLQEQSFDVCGRIGSLLSANVVESLGAKLPTEKWDKLNVEVQKLLN